MDISSANDLEYLDKLEQYLESDQSPPNSMYISDLDGFLTGIVIGPELILPSEWLPVVWGGEEPVFLDAEQAAEITSAILKRYNDIRATLRGERWTISPIFWEGPDGSLIAMDWAEGFMDAVRLRIDAWQPLFLHRTKADLLMPILILCCDQDGKSYLPEILADDDVLIKTAPELIPDVVDAIYWFWQERSVTPVPFRAEATQGRNEPCHCGSGKKFKRCCGTS